MESARGRFLFHLCARGAGTPHPFRGSSVELHSARENALNKAATTRIGRLWNFQSSSSASIRQFIRGRFRGSSV